MISYSSKKGFTIVELSISIAFLSILLIAVGTITARIVALTQKGITINAVNDNGRELIDEFTRGINMSSYRDFYNSEDRPGDKFGLIYHQVTRNDKPYYGAFCTGYYSYIWNTGYALNLTNSAEIANYQATYTPTDSNVAITGFRLLRVSDATRSVCENYYDSSVSKNRYTGGDDPVEILSDTESGLVLYDFKVGEPAYDSHSHHALYAATFILGTLRGDVDINATSDACKDTTSDLSSDFSYCAVNKFNFAARATGGIFYD